MADLALVVSKVVFLVSVYNVSKKRKKHKMIDK